MSPHTFKFSFRPGKALRRLTGSPLARGAREPEMLGRALARSSVQLFPQHAGSKYLASIRRRIRSHLATLSARLALTNRSEARLRVLQNGSLRVRYRAAAGAPEQQPLVVHANGNVEAARRLESPALASLRAALRSPSESLLPAPGAAP